MCVFIVIVALISKWYHPLVAGKKNKKWYAIDMLSQKNLVHLWN